MTSSGRTAGQPQIDIGLAARGQGAGVAAQPGEEADGVGDVDAGALGGGRLGGAGPLPLATQDPPGGVGLDKASVLDDIDLVNPGVAPRPSGSAARSGGTAGLVEAVLVPAPGTPAAPADRRSPSTGERRWCCAGRSARIAPHPLQHRLDCRARSQQVEHSGPMAITAETWPSRPQAPQAASRVVTMARYASGRMRAHSGCSWRTSESPTARRRFAGASSTAKPRTAPALTPSAPPARAGATSHEEGCTRSPHRPVRSSRPRRRRVRR